MQRTTVILNSLGHSDGLIAPDTDVQFIKLVKLWNTQITKRIKWSYSIEFPDKANSWITNCELECKLSNFEPDTYGLNPLLAHIKVNYPEIFLLFIW